MKVTKDADNRGKLERGYRRLIRFYPRSFRAESTDEIVTVLLATAPEGQRRPSAAECLDLLRGAARMHMGLSRTPRTLLYAVRLMCLGALAELGVLITIAVTAGDIRASLLADNRWLARDPHKYAWVVSEVNTNITIDLIALPLMAVAWIGVAWANGKGSELGRVAAVGVFMLATVGLLTGLGQDAVRYAPAALAASGVAWVIGLAAVTLTFCGEASSYYERQSA